MLSAKHRRTAELVVAVIVIGAVVSSIVIAYSWQSIFPSKYPIALSNIIFSTDNQIETVSIGIKTGNATEPVRNWITLNTTGLEPLATPQVLPQGGKYATSDYITPTTYSVGQTVVIDRTANSTQVHEQLTITITSDMLQYTAGYYVNMQARPLGYAIAIPSNSTWNTIS